jgi:4-alpha-glucanotransferase
LETTTINKPLFEKIVHLNKSKSIVTRCSGLLLHPTSLPGPYGMGSLGPEAYWFADMLKAMGQTRWQVLPLYPTGYGDSPYQALSAFAGNPLLISPEILLKENYLSSSAVPAFPKQSASFLDFELVKKHRDL